MTEEATRKNTGPNDRAGEKYEIVVKSAPRLEWGLRCFAALVAEVVVAGGELVPGGERISVRERGSGETVAKFKQQFGSDGESAHKIKGHLRTLTVDEFEDKWIKAP